MSIIGEQVLEYTYTRIAEVFYILGCFGNVASVPKAPVISYSCISYFGHACLKLKFALISRLTGKCTTQNFY